MSILRGTHEKRSVSDVEHCKTGVILRLWADFLGGTTPSGPARASVFDLKFVFRCVKKMEYMLWA